MRFLIELMASAFLVCFAGSSHATLISTYAEQVDNPRVASIDQKFGTSGIIQSQVSYQDHVNSSAIAASNGSLQVFVPEGQAFWDIGFRSFAKATWAESIINDTSVALNISYDFLINSLLSINGTWNEDHQSRSSYSVELFMNNEVFWQSSVVLDNEWGFGEFTDINITQPIIQGEDLEGVFTLDAGPRTTYLIENYTSSLSLATLLPGDSLLLEVIVSASANACEQLADGVSSSLSLYGYFGFTPVEVPEPATIFLFGAAIVILGGTMLKRENLIN